MNKVGEYLRRTSLWTAISAVLVLALPAPASAQFMDPVLEQYAPSTEQIAEKVKAGGGGQGGGDGQIEGEPQADQGNAGGAGQGDDGEGGDGSGNVGIPGGGGDDGGNAGGGGAGGGAATPSEAGDAGLDARLLSGLPVTWFDFLAFAIATGALIGTALLFRRLSRSPRVEG